MDNKEASLQLPLTDGDEQFSRDEQEKDYYGEYVVLQNILENLPGYYKILMDVDLPAFDKKTGIDLLIVHECGIFVLEIKYYTGDIHGKSEEAYWTQHYKTIKDNPIVNPVKENDYHMGALKEYTPKVPLYSVIVFVNNESNLSNVINTRDDLIITNLNNLSSVLTKSIEGCDPALSAAEVESIFLRLDEFSNIGKIFEPFVDHQPLGLNELLSRLRDDYSARVKKLKKETEAQRSRYFKSFIITVSVTLLAMLALFYLGVNNVIGF